MRKVTEMLDSPRAPVHRAPSPGRGRAIGTAETGAAIGITITTITIPFSSVALASHSLALDTLMDTDTAATIPTVATTPPLTTAVATTVAAITVAAATTTADITATVIAVAAIMEHAVILVPVRVPVALDLGKDANQGLRSDRNN